MIEFKPGADLIDQFPALSLDEKKKVLEQFANIFAAIQAVKLPIGVTKFGGMTFNEAGEIVSGQMPLLVGGPWDDYESVWISMLRY